MLWWLVHRNHWFSCLSQGCSFLSKLCLHLADLKAYILALPPKVWHCRCYSIDIALSTCTLCTHLHELALQVQVKQACQRRIAVVNASASDLLYVYLSMSEPACTLFPQICRQQLVIQPKVQASDRDVQCLTVDSAEYRPAVYNTAAQAAPMSAFRL